ncbi:MAG: ROK family protein [Verrucomicrobia bacterium]|nr:ROK family protein [Verrucomicrobiota bacterium]MDA1088053.1 ROK family protein [Verrucomicrobiota bacterium]
MTDKTRDLFLGVDLGGTDIKSTVTTRAGEILVNHMDKVLSLASDGPAVTVGQMKIAADKALQVVGGSWDEVVYVGLDTPGPASLDGVLARSPNLRHPDWLNFPVRAAFEKAIGKPVVYANDGNAAAYWEYFRLFGDAPDKILGAAILGTGLGGAMVQGGHVLAGARGYGAEFGHVRLPTYDLVTDGDVPVCGCGKKACSEAFVSLTALDRQLRKIFEGGEYLDHPLREVPDEGRARATRLLRLAQEGDALALELFDTQARALGLLFVQLAHAFDPHLFLIGGGITESSEAFRTRYLRGVKESFQREAFPLLGQEIEIAYTGDQDAAGCRGAALLARRYAKEHGL